MTTSHRPTFTPALGNSKTTITESYSARNSTVVPMKSRQKGQGAKDDMEDRNLKEELAKKERDHQDKLKKEKFAKTALQGEVQGTEEEEEKEEPPAKRPRLLDQVNSKLDADDSDDDSDDDDDDKKGGKDNDDDDDDDEDDDDDDDEAELLRELEKIKRERALEQEKKAREAAEQEEQIRTEQVLTGNPLLAGDFSLKKKWYDDVVFKNCAKKNEKDEKRFINDIIRSDFHRKFMNKYIQ